MTILYVRIDFMFTCKFICNVFYILSKANCGLDHPYLMVQSVQVHLCLQASQGFLSVQSALLGQWDRKVQKDRVHQYSLLCPAHLCRRADPGTRWDRLVRWAQRGQVIQSHLVGK